ncbi:efflux RND transporter permease subunit [Varunaivibrio sulfuroxidans]|uniref:Multidrug efflux pump n=1 Tax=Varunaivibrio sulfuroxidans TaxID=1773489 RepID=A0A4V2UNQ7_9PROT|nr:efflux RND transporter permease subunit [Varunaivibrio sulfuroxidans]TCS62941.1 multidrug efflux pump [Varunaivibrio sulfuroxidans]WES31983.1 efflux RND transporter permease subunit [Varunaivibrio sulfuroxidans]
MKALIDAAFSRSRTVIATLVLLLIAGTVAFVEIPKEAEPDIKIPYIIVGITHEGISPEDAERLLLRPIEQEVRSVEGLKEMRSRAYQGGASIVLEFEAGFNADKALRDTRDRVDTAKSKLPDGTDDPTVKEINISLFPVVVATLSGDLPERALLKLGRDLKDRIEGLTPVLEANIAGDRTEQIEIVIDPARVESYGLSPDQAAALVRSSNLLVAAGFQDTGHGRFSLKVPGLLETLGDIAALPVKVKGDAVVRLGDIADIRRSYKDPTSFARVNGRPTVALEISKRLGANIIDTVNQVHAAINAESKNWPANVRRAVHIGYSQDKSKQVKTWLNDLKNNVLSAIVLVMVVVIAALGVRSSILVGISIPGSFLSGILVIAMFGMTLNTVVLFALILSVGMLVDGAIVVTEFADRKMTEGETRKVAYAMAAKRMAWPIIASTATTLAAFLPLMFWPGIVGEFMKYLPITLVIVLSASLVMALIFVPTLGAYIGKPGAASQAAMRAIAGGESGHLEDVGGFTGWYLDVLRRALRRPAWVLAAAVAVLVGVQVAYGFFGKGVEFFPNVEPEVEQVLVRARGNLSIYEQDALMRKVENRIFGVAGVRSVYTRTGAGSGGAANNAPEDTIGTIFIEFKDWDKRPPVQQIQDAITARTKDIAGIVIDQVKRQTGPQVGKPIQIQFSSRFPELLPDAVKKTRAFMAGMDGLMNIEDSRPLPGIDWVFKVDRGQAAKFGVTISQIGSAIRMASTGVKLGSYRPNDSDDEIDIRARYPARDRTLSELDHIRLETGGGAVPLSNFVTRVAEPRVSTLSRVDAKRVLTIKADVREGVLASAKLKTLRAWVAKAGFDPRVDITFKGEDKDQKDASAFLKKAFAVALFIMAIILVTQFNSFYSAFLILSAVIMSTIGVFIGLLVTGHPFGIVMSGIGVIALAGIVVNNNIVLIDTFDHLSTTTASAMDAILRTGAQRLRPVMLTSITTILGLLPMVFRVNIDFMARDVSVGAPSTQMWSQLSIAIVFGLTFSTVLTLVVTPSALMVRANVRAWRERRRRDKAIKNGTGGASEDRGTPTP